MPSFQAYPLDPRPLTHTASHQAKYMYTIQGRYMHRFSIIFLLSELFPCLHNDSDNDYDVACRWQNWVKFLFYYPQQAGQTARVAERGGSGGSLVVGPFAWSLLGIPWM